MSGTRPDTLLVVTENSSVKELRLSAISVAPSVIYGLVWQASVQLNTICSPALPYLPARAIDNIRPSVIIRNPDTSARTAEKSHFFPFRIISSISAFMCAPPGHQLRMRPHLCWEMERQTFQPTVNGARCWDSGGLESFRGLGVRASLTGRFGGISCFWSFPNEAECSS